MPFDLVNRQIGEVAWPSDDDGDITHGFVYNVLIDLKALIVFAKVLPTTGKLPKALRSEARAVLMRRETFSDRLKVHTGTSGGGGCSAVVKFAMDKMIEQVGDVVTDDPQVLSNDVQQKVKHVVDKFGKALAFGSDDKKNDACWDVVIETAEQCTAEVKSFAAAVDDLDNSGDNEEIAGIVKLKEDFIEKVFDVLKFVLEKNKNFTTEYTNLVEFNFNWEADDNGEVEKMFGDTEAAFQWLQMVGEILGYFDLAPIEKSLVKEFNTWCDMILKVCGKELTPARPPVRSSACRQAETE